MISFQKIGDKTLRIGKIVKSAFHDGLQTKWFHFKCIFGSKSHPGLLDEVFLIINNKKISEINNIKWDDQEKVQKLIEEYSVSERIQKVEVDISFVLKQKKCSCISEYKVSLFK